MSHSNYGVFYVAAGKDYIDKATEFDITNS